MILLVIASVWSLIGAEPVMRLTPSDPLIIPVLTPTNVSCSTSDSFTGWKILDENNVTTSNRRKLSKDNWKYAEGFTAIQHTDESSLLINTSSPGLYYVHCIVVSEDGNLRNMSIKLTVYGVPDSAYNMSIKTDDMFMEVAWSYPRIERIVVTFHLKLIFSKPSELLNTTAVILNKKYFHIILEGKESYYDPFTLCITSNNSVGRSNSSCINGSLPYVPSQDMISYSLSQSQGSYILSVLIERPLCLQDSYSYYILQVINSQTLINMSSLETPANNYSIISIGNLTENTSYLVKLLSINTYGVRKIQLGKICTPDIEESNASFTSVKDTYKPSCDYIEEYLTTSIMKTTMFVIPVVLSIIVFIIIALVVIILLTLIHQKVSRRFKEKSSCRAKEHENVKCVSNLSYDVIKVCSAAAQTDDLTCDVNPSYNIIKGTKDHSTTSPGIPLYETVK